MSKTFQKIRDYCTDSQSLVDSDCLFAPQVLYLQQAEVTREQVYAMHQTSIDGVEDMSALAELHEAAIMHNLYKRYQDDNIYVSVSRDPLFACKSEFRCQYR